MGAFVKRGDGPLVAIGAAICALGLWLWSFASPSPHGYIELIFALPAICVGLIVIGSALAWSHRPNKGFWFWLGAGMLVLAALPVLLVVALLVYGAAA